MLNPLEQLFTHFAYEEGNASVIHARANPYDYPQCKIDHLPVIDHIERDARLAGEYISKQEEVSEEDVAVIVDIVHYISEFAINEQNAIKQEKSRGKSTGIPAFFSNSLEFARVFVLEPIFNVLREKDSYGNLDGFKSICNSSADVLSILSGDLADTYHAASGRLKEIYAKAFKQREEVATEN